jgi:hypothetical protein
MTPPSQDVLAFEGLMSDTNYEAVPAGMADEVVANYRRRARKFVAYRLVGVLVAGIIATAVLFRFVRSLEVAGGVGVAFVVIFGAVQLRARDQGVPEVVARGVDPGTVRTEYGIDPTEPEELLDDG